MTGPEAVAQLRQEQHFFNNIANGFAPEHGGFRPRPEMMCVAEQIAHVASTVDWFREAAFGSGFRMDFENLAKAYLGRESLEEARAALARAYDEFAALLSAQSEAALGALLPDNPILGRVPRFAVLAANADHTAHHRGALAVYQRLLGFAPKMVYAE